MREECRPYRNKGDRNVFCSNYNHCLDHAIAQSWNSWSCGKCKSGSNQAIEEKMSITREFITYYECNVPFINLDQGLPDIDPYGDLDFATV
jgi:hypothetical protein